MKLGTDVDENSQTVRAAVGDQVEQVSRQVLSRAHEAVRVLLRARLQVLEGQRSGRVYKKPCTHGAPSKATRALMGAYGHKLKGGQLYRASAPGEPPARRTGNLRLHWNGRVRTGAGRTSKGIEVSAEIESREKYAYNLEKGIGMAPRPFVDRIKRKAAPEIVSIYSRPYT